jgi:hypothetical protein
MRYSREEIAKNLNSIDRQLLLMIYDELCEQNRLLRHITNENDRDTQIPDEHKETSTNDLDALKRPELLKRMATLSNNPQGWHKWGTEDIRKHLKGVS